MNNSLAVGPKKDSVLALPGDPLWYKNAIIYEVHIRAFCDSDGDGVGDFRGLTEKLDYIHELGATTIWLLPFYASPWKDDGYDISDYTQVHPAYGSLSDFKIFLREAHRRGLRVITELVLNHTSDQHSWFQRSRRAAPGTAWRDFYVWSGDAEKYKEVRVIFKDFESSNWAWDPIAKAYYWHRFYSHQPDLNYDNPKVQKAIFQVVDYWLELGVDGFRLDAVPYLFERENTSCENLPQTFEFLEKLRQHISGKFQDRILLAEANQWPEDAVAYFGSGRLCHMAFHFPLMPRMFMAVRMEDRYPIVDILEHTPQIPEHCQWALFLRNHDELTLEMVTDEERDYMYRIYASDVRARINLGIRHRLAPLLGKDRKKIELMYALLFSLPGTPVIYYGDEIAMGDNIYLGDRNGVRTPMQWSADRNAGFSRANPQRLYLPINIDPDYHYEVVNVETSQNSLHSVLWFVKRLVALRKRFQAFGRGNLEFLSAENRKILAFVRTYRDEVILVVANLSRFVQYVELDLTAFKEMIPVELAGHTEFPPIGDSPYFLSLSPHAFYWFSLVKQTGGGSGPFLQTAGVLELGLGGGDWKNVFREKGRSLLENALAAYLQNCRWMGAHNRTLNAVRILDAIPVPHEPFGAYMTIIESSYSDGEPQIYMVPLAFTTNVDADRVLPQDTIVARFTGSEPTGIVYDAAWDQDFCDSLLESIARRRRHRGSKGELIAWPTPAFLEIREGVVGPLRVSTAKGQQRNTSLLFGDRYIWKMFRRLWEGPNPEWEMGSYLAEKIPLSPKVLGVIEYSRKMREPMTLAVLQSFVQNQGDAWTFTVDVLGRYFERAAVRLTDSPPAKLEQVHLLDLAEKQFPTEYHEPIGIYVEAAHLLGLRTAELHLVLAAELDDPRFAPEPFSIPYQRSAFQRMRNGADQVFAGLRRRLPDIPAEVQQDARWVLELKEAVSKKYQLMVGRKITAQRTRIHGDYHLGEVLCTGKDFVIIDFEGDPAEPPTQRMIKRSPLRDVASMLHSFSAAAYSTLSAELKRGMIRVEDFSRFEDWARFWIESVSAIFLNAYFEVAARGTFLPPSREELQVLFDAYALDRAVRDLGRNLDASPDQIGIALKGLLRFLPADPGLRLRES